MLVRILTALIAIPFFLGLLYVGQWPLFALVAGMGLIGFHEYTRMWRMKEVRVAYTWGSLCVLGFQAWTYLAPENGLLLGALITAMILSLFIWQLRYHPARTVLDASVSLIGVLYVGWLLSHLLLLRQLSVPELPDAGLRWIAFSFFCTWAADSFAYFVGQAIGRHPLAPLLSPKKSVEGMVGGSAGALLLGAIFGPQLGISAWEGGVIGLVISFVAVLGDLAESALKRYTGVKDSGTLLPGHGGVLDRFDSSLFVLPFVYYVVRLFYIQ